MDMDCDLSAKVLIIPKDKKWTSEACGDIKGLSWTNKYAFAAVNTLGQKTVYCDGMNEKGLSAANLYLEETIYPAPKEGEKILAVMDMVSWILGNFESVDEVKIALKDTTIWGNVYKPWNMICKLHFVVHDANGKTLIIEWLDGKMKLYEPEGSFCVLTNSPQFTEQMKFVQSTTPCSNDVTQSKERFKFLYLIIGKYFQANSDCKNFLVPVSEIIARAATVRGEDPEGNGKYFSTKFTVLRDHTNRKFYIKFDTDLNYREIDF